MLHDDSEKGVAEGTDEGRVDLYAAYAEELLDAVTSSCVQRAAKESASGGIGALLRLAILIELGFFLGSAESEKGEDVGFAEGRLGAVGRLEAG